MGERLDVEALRKVTSLVDYLADLTDSASRDPVRDICGGAARAPEPQLWCDQFPDGIVLDTESEEVLLAMAPVGTAVAPPLPDELVGLVDPAAIRSVDGPPPLLRDPGEDEWTDEQRARLRAAFQHWLARWQSWARDEPARKHRRDFYQELEGIAKKLEQRDDEYELVLATGLVTWRAPGDVSIRRHLLTEQLSATLDRAGVVTITRSGRKRRMEDRDVFGELTSYRPDRGRVQRDAIVSGEWALLGETTARALREWLSFAVDVPCEERRDRPSSPSEVMVFSATPAVLLRPRGRHQLAEAYRRIAEALKLPDAQVPVSLAQVIVDTERDQREKWLIAQGAAPGDVLGTDPLFPLAANAQQTRVMELLRTETGIVVQGPPGTGKTHTIANLISALLARGQRVLVTSQKDQALRVLRDKIPAELRKLCVLLTGGSKDAAVASERTLG